LVVFVLVTADVLAGGPLSRLDREVSQWARSTGLPGRGWRRPWQRELDQAVNFGDRQVAGLIVVVALGWICWRARTLLPLVRLAGLCGVTAAVVSALKVGIARGAPAGVQNDHPFRSYPSGHTVTAVVLWGLLAAVVAEHPRRGVSREVARVLGWLAPLLTVTGMVLRDYHWLSDLLGGVMLGVVLVQAERLALRHWRRARASAGPAGTRAPPAAAGDPGTGAARVAAAGAGRRGRARPG